MKHITFLVLLCLSANGLFAQSAERPKIGLVLSGGGAKGMAHIGILKELESLGIRPDYITGTSMGSVVGGLYAAGYTASEIEAIALAINWDELLSNNTSMNQINYQEKAYYQRYLVELGLKKGKIELPQGLIDGQRLSELLSKLTRHVHHINDFNELPIPFACVGTDIATGQPVVMRSGSLPMAIRASMAIPSIFTPVERNDTLLVDGGLVRNFPVPECQEMGADIIIGVFVSGGLLKKEELKSAVDVLSQSAFVMSALDSEEQMKKCDLLIEPDISLFSTMGFEDTPAIIRSGEAAAEAARPALRALADSLGLVPFDVNELIPERPDSFRIANIIVRNNVHTPDSYVKGRLRIEEGSAVSIDYIDDRVDVLFGSRNFDKVVYEMMPNGDEYDLVLTVEEAPQAQIKLALHYDNENGTGINLNFTKRNLLPASRLLLEFDLAENPRGDANFLKYMGARQNWIAKAGINYRSSDVPIVDSDDRQEGIFRNRYLNPYFNIINSKRRNYQWGGLFQYESSLLKPDIAGEELRFLNRFDWRSFSVQTFADYNSLNARYFPTKGAVYGGYVKYSFPKRYKIQLSDSLGTVDLPLDIENFLSFEIHQENHWLLSSKFSIGLKNAMVMNFIERSNALLAIIPFINDQQFVGGYRPLLRNSWQLWGAEQLMYISDHMYYNEISIQYEPIANLYLQVVSQYANALYPMKWFYGETDDGYYDFPEGKHEIWSYGAMASYVTILGPVSAGIAHVNGSNSWNSFVSIGFYF